MSKFKTHKNEKNICEMGAHLQYCVYNHYAKFEHKGMNTLGVPDYTN